MVKGQNKNKLYDKRKANSSSVDNEYDLEKNIRKINSYSNTAFDENTLLYKIGRSSNPFKRIKGSSTFSPFVKLMFVSDRDVESAIHNKYSKCRKLGEWFDLPEKDLCDIVNNYDFVKYEGR